MSGVLLSSLAMLPVNQYDEHYGVVVAILQWIVKDMYRLNIGCAPVGWGGDYVLIGHYKSQNLLIVICVFGA